MCSGLGGWKRDPRIFEVADIHRRCCLGVSQCHESRGSSIVEGQPRGMCDVEVSFKNIV